MNAGQGRYGAQCDWWSLGCVMWEMLYGMPPFSAEDLVVTYSQIMEHGQKRVNCNYDYFR
jgi:serine/threonine-protein kinase MRCK